MKHVRLAALALGLSALPAQALTFAVTNIGLGGIGNASVVGINAKGQVAGFAALPDWRTHAYIATISGTTDIGELGCGLSVARALGSNGHVVGEGYVAPCLQTSYHAFSWTQGGGIVDIGTLGGEWSTPVAVNGEGKVAGTSEDGAGNWRAFSWTAAGGIVALPTLGGTWSEAYAMNAAGQIAGYSMLPGNQTFHAVIWQPDGSVVDLGSLGGQDYSAAFEINDAGQVAGIWQSVSSPNIVDEHTFVWTPGGGMVDAGTLGGHYSFPSALNAGGRAIGSSLTSGYDFGTSRGFTWSPGGGMVDLTLGGAKSSASAVNDAGSVIGAAMPVNSAAYHAFLWTPSGGMRDLGTFGGSTSVGYHINSAGRAVGYSMLPGDTTTHGFLHDDGVLLDLTDRLANKPAGLEILQAFRINDSDAIVAWSNTGTVLLTPASATNAAPAVGPIVASDPVAVGTALPVSVSFTDAATDTHTASWTWGDGATSAGSVSESGGNGTAAGTHVFAAAGIYPVTVKVIDSGGLSSQVTRNVVVYDPAAGFVTGSGWIVSPAGAFRADATVAGRATFAFVSRYQKGANVPTGTTEFHFQAAQLDFHSESYDWLVVSGARGQFKGTGTLNGVAGHKFLLTAIDGNVAGGGGVDRFRIKIWRHDDALDQDVVVYDNQLSTATEGTTSEGTAIGGGSIVIHASK